jgi:glycosyltransferase involved in cell wall biosynthesis
MTIALKSQEADQGVELITSALNSESKSEHVLFLIDRFPQRMGGAEGTLLKITRLLPPARYRCSVVTFAIDPAFEDIHGLFKCPLHVLPLRRTYDLNAFRVALQISRLIRSERVSIVHTFFPTSDLWGGMIAKLSGCPVLISSRRDMGLNRSAKHRLAYRLLRGMFDQVQTVSDQVRSFSIANDGLAPSKIFTLRNGVDLDEVQEITPLKRSDSTLGVEDASHLIATVGNIRPVKGTDILIRTAARVCEQFPRAVFLVIGRANDSQYFRGIQELTNSLGLSRNVRFLGLRNDVISILKTSDMFFLPSRSEGLSNALLEAMACKLPCVATEVGGNAEVVENGKSGFLVPSENPELAAERITRLLRDPHSAREMGEAGRRIIEERFTAQEMVNRLVSFYDSLLKAKNARLSRTR